MGGDFDYFGPDCLPDMVAGQRRNTVEIGVQWKGDKEETTTADGIEDRGPEMDGSDGFQGWFWESESRNKKKKTAHVNEGPTWTWLIT